MIDNPFPGPAPYRAVDRGRFLGREELARRVTEAVLGHRSTTLYGPDGAGKTSLLAASVLPLLGGAHDARVVHVRDWPLDRDPTATLARALYTDLRVTPPAADLPPHEATLDAVKRAVRASPRLLILCLDQLEQLFTAGRAGVGTGSLLACVEQIVDLPTRPVRILLSFQEEYLGRFIEHQGGRLRLMECSFRVGHLTVAELCPLICRIAAMGLPAQAWFPDDVLPWLIEMRLHDQPESDRAEVRMAYVQSFFRALFERRAEGKSMESTAVRREMGALVERTVIDLEVPDEPEETR